MEKVVYEPKNPTATKSRYSSGILPRSCVKPTQNPRSIDPEIIAANSFKNDNKKAKDYRNIGFGTLLTHQKDGIARGTGGLVLLSKKKEHQKKEINKERVKFFKFHKVILFTKFNQL